MLIVIFETEVRNQILATDPAECILSFIGVNLAGSDLRIIIQQTALKVAQGLVYGSRPMEDFCLPTPDQTIRDAPLLRCKLWISSISISALSILVRPSLTFGPLMRRTYSGSKTAFIGRIA